jgi:hypothetical protein
MKKKIMSKKMDPCTPQLVVGVACDADTSAVTGTGNAGVGVTGTSLLPPPT